MIVLPTGLSARRTVDQLVSLCVSCASLIVQVQTGSGTGAFAFVHVADQCQECFGTGEPCPCPENHGVHRFSLFVNGRRETVTCTEAEAGQCRWCRRVFDATEKPCPDHRECCGNCCEPY